ncbi:MAG: PorV/PorQ family protein [candidate division KSB1 bacterium]|nr:PorV/PorQ family protein [candidate division KSB1 bacterium]
MKRLKARIATGIWYLLIIGLWAGESLWAQGIGSLGAPVLRISPNARQVGMGEAFTAMANDYNLLRYNVGGLGILRHVMLTTNFHRWIDDTQQGDIELFLPMRFGVAGFAVTYFNEGKVIGYNENFQPTGITAESNDLLLSFGYGAFFKLLGNTFAFGAGGKFIRQDLAGHSASGVGLDVGAVYAMKHISIGATLQNLTVNKLKFNNRAELLPETVRAGIALRLPVGRHIKWNLATDVAKMRHENDLRIYSGTEIRISDLIALRGGYKFHATELSRWAFGFGLIVPMQWLAGSRTEIDYAFTPLEPFDTFAHRFSFTFVFGAARKVEPVVPVDTEQITQLQKQLSEELLAAREARRRMEEAEARTRALQEEMARRLEHIQQIALTSAGKIEVIPDREDSNRILVSLRINFDFDSAVIRPEEYDTMHKIGEILNTYPESKVWIAGHTDSVGTEEYNILLSQRRMESVMHYLITKEGVDPDRFFMPVAYGESRPIESNATEAGRARNRRVDFTIFTGDAEPEVPLGSAVRSVEALSDTAFAIICNGIVNFELEEFDNPPRLAVDFPGIFDLSSKKVFEFNRGIVQRARIGYHRREKFTRVVFDLTRPGRYAARAVDNSVVIYIRE